MKYYGQRNYMTFFRILEKNILTQKLAWKLGGNRNILLTQILK